MTYELQPGTIPYRVVTWLKLQPKGAEFTAATIGEELGIEKGNIQPCMKLAVKHGVVAFRKESGMLYWSLGDGKAASRPDDDDHDEPLHKAPVAPDLSRASIFPTLPPKLPKRCQPKVKKAAAPAVRTRAPVVHSVDVLASFDSMGLFTFSKGVDALILTPAEAKAVAEFVGRISCN